MPTITTNKLMHVMYSRINRSKAVSYALDAFGNIAHCFKPSYVPGRLRSCHQIAGLISKPTTLEIRENGIYESATLVSNNTFLAQSLLEHGITGLNLQPGLSPEDLICLSKTGHPCFTNNAVAVSDQQKAKDLLTIIKDKNLMLSLRTLGFAAIFSSTAYFITRIVSLAQFEGNTWDKVFSLGVVLGVAVDAFLVYKNQGHLISAANFSSPTVSDTTKQRIVTENGPIVSILVPAINEPIDLMEQTLLAAGRQAYKNKEVILLLDDALGSPSVAPTHEMVARVNVTLAAEGHTGCVKIFQRKKYPQIYSKGYKAGNLNGFMVNAMGREITEYQDRDGTWKITEDAPPSSAISSHQLSYKKPNYVVVIDADYKLYPQFLVETVSVLEENANLALVQTPQNLIPTTANETELVSGACLSSYWQYSRRGTAQEGAVFWGGVNCTIRMDALESIKQTNQEGVLEYIPSKNITEDLYTTLLLFQKGWKTSFLPTPLADGMPITNLADHFSTFWRYVEGTTEATLEQTLPYMLKDPKFGLSRQGVEMLAHGIQPFVGASSLFFAVCPMIATLGIADFAPSSMAAFIPLFILNFYLNGLSSKRIMREFAEKQAERFPDSIPNIYQARKWDHLKSGLLFLIHFPVYIHGQLSAIYNLILGKKAKFARTPKDGTRSMVPLKYLLPILGTISLNTISFGISMEQLATTGEKWRLIPAVWSLLFAGSATYALINFNGLKNTALDLGLGLKSAAKRFEASRTGLFLENLAAEFPV